MSVKLLKYPLLLFFHLFVLSITVRGQIQIVSPYSRFGIGDLTANTNAYNSSMGGIGYGVRSYNHVNYLNPASYTAFDSVSFLFEGGAIGSFVTLNSNIESVTRSYASLGYLIFGFPVVRWWKTSLGLLPFSDVGYSIRAYSEIEGIGHVTRVYNGSGGINQFYWGNGFKLFKGFSLGFNAAYLFGSMNREAEALFPDSAYFLNAKLTNYITVSDIYFDFGIQYQYKTKKGLSLTTGLVFAPKTLINAKTDMLEQTFYLGASGTEYPKDTILKSDGYKGTITIPTMIGLGVSCEKTDKWLVGVDFRWQNWKDFKAFNISDSLVNSLQINAGAEIIPDITSYTNYLKRIRYRLGFKYDNTYLMLRGKRLDEYAFSLGFGFPLRGNRTMINLGAQVGTRGTTEAGLIKDSYFKFTLGFTLYERWFVKRKYY